MSKSDALLLFLISLITSAMISNVVLLPIRAQTVVATTAHVSVEPDAIGVGQMANVSMCIEPPPPSPPGNLSGLTLHVVNPDNTTTWWVGPFFTDSSGSAFVILVFDQVGIYTLQMNYTGESLENETIFYKSATSTIITLNVTQDIPALTPEPTPTPTSTTEPTHTPSPSPAPSTPPAPSTAPQPTATSLPSPTASPLLIPNPQSEPFPTALSESASGASIVVIAVVLLVSLKKRK